MTSRGLAGQERRLVECARCPRLVRCREDAARAKKRQFQDDVYWGRPVPGFGDPRARVLVVGLAPAAHGANRTGRMFTGDGTDGNGASDFLMRALHRAGFANQPTSRRRDDGLRLRDLWLTAIVRCAPPENRPRPEEIRNCADWLRAEMRLLPHVRVVVALGKLAFDQMAARLAESAGIAPARPRPRFAHGAEVHVAGDAPCLLASYHPSRQNTQTGRLTEPMLAEVLRRARDLAEAGRRGKMPRSS